MEISCFTIAKLCRGPLVYASHSTDKLLFTFLGLALLSFLPSLTLPYIGEEAVYTISSLEMWISKQWFIPTVYGAGYGRPPLFNWCIIPFANLLGWNHMLIASRLSAGMTTFASGLILYQLVQTLFKNKTFTLFTLCLYFSGDLLVRRGWLAYADPLFALGILIAISSTWMALEKKQSLWFFLTTVGLIVAYLSKALTGFIFYGISLIVFIYFHPHRQLLFKPQSLFFHVLPLLFLFFWGKNVDVIHNQSMMSDIVTRLNQLDLSSYWIKFIAYPVDSFIRFFPYSALLLLSSWQYWHYHKSLKAHNETISFFSLVQKLLPIKNPTHTSLNDHRTKFLIAFWILILNYFPYWIFPYARARYLLPLFPFFAIVAAYLIIIWDKKIKCLKPALFCIGGCIVVKYALVFLIDPYYEKKNRGDYQATAQKILEIVDHQPLYTNDASSVGLSITAHLDVLRLPKPPLTAPPVAKIHTNTSKTSLEWSQGFLLSHTMDVSNTKLAQTFVLGTHKIYLLCRGESCESNHAQ